MRTRTLLALLLAAGLAAAQERDPFKGPTREVSDAQGRIRLTVPAGWEAQPVAGGRIMSLHAPGQRGLGGHQLTVDVEPLQTDRNAQRDRYRQHDEARDPKATIRICETPYFGYRVDLPGLERKLVIVRAFLTQGGDGLVLTVTSRLDSYDAVWAAQIEAVVASARAGEGTPRPAEASVPDGAPRRRVRDAAARVSLLAAARWQPVETSDPDEWLVLSTGGAAGGARLAFVRQGAAATRGLVLGKVFSEWKEAYGEIAQETFPGDPPRMIVRGRKPETVDYVIALQVGRYGYTVTLTVRETELARFRPDADLAAESAVLADAPYVPPEPPNSAVQRSFKQLVVVHAPDAASADAVIAALSGFEKASAGFAFGDARKAPPLRVLVASEGDFAEAAHGFGAPPCAYDLQSRVVVCSPPPPAEAERWRGRLFSELGRSLLHRDLAFPAPPWFREGVASCLEAAGRAGALDAAFPGLAERVAALAESGSLLDLPAVLSATDADFLREEALDLRAASWGYLHVMLFGKGLATQAYRKWTKSVAAARERAPAFDTKGLERVREELAKHAARLWGGKG
jgi:hypothetical protein